MADPVQALLIDADRAVAIGDITRAIDCHRKALDLLQQNGHWVDSKRSAAISNNLGNLLEQSGQLEGARSAWSLACDLDSALDAAWENLVASHIGATELVQALRILDAGLESRPDNARLWAFKGRCHQAWQQRDAAIAAFEQSLAIDPAHESAHMGMAIYAHNAGDRDAVRHHYDFCRGGVNADAAEINRLLTLPMIPDSREEIVRVRAEFDEGLDALSDRALEITNPIAQLPFTTFRLAYHGLDDRPLQEKTGALLYRSVPQLRFQASRVIGFRDCSWRKRTRLRVGFVSAFFRRHTITKLFGGVMQHMDQTRFETVLFPAGPWQPDDVASSIQDDMDQCIPLGENLAIAQQRLADAECDVLIFWDIGMETLTWLLAFGRYAPIQMVSWGHPMTTGSPNMDYFLSCSGMELADQAKADKHYTEKLVALPHIGTWFERPVADKPDHVRNQFAFGKGNNIYLCPQSMFKIHPDFDDIVAEILRTDPDGEVVFLAASHLQWTQKLQARWQAVMPDVAHRIRVLPGQSQEGYYHLVMASDVILDTPHFCGGNSTYEILAFGKPVISWGSDFAKGRITTSLLSDLGVTDGIAPSLKAYAGKAVRMAISPKRRERYQEAIRDNAHKLYSNAAGLEDLQAFLQAEAETISWGIA